MLTVTKQYRDFPAGHRQHTHEGHCALVHGHSWGVDLTFSATKLDENGFVVDFGKLKMVKEMLDGLLDHTCLLCSDDPELETFRQLEARGLFDLRVIPAVSAEGIAEWIMENVHLLIDHDSGGRVELTEVVVWEDSKNCATLENN